MTFMYIFHFRLYFTAMYSNICPINKQALLRRRLESFIVCTEQSSTSLSRPWSYDSCLQRLRLSSRTAKGTLRDKGKDGDQTLCDSVKTQFIE